MATEAALRYLIQTQDRDLKELQKELRSVNKTMGTDTPAAADRAGGGMHRARGAAKLLVGAVGIAGVVGALKSSVSAAMDAEKAQNRLESQMKALNLDYKGHKSAIDGAVNSTSRLAALDDEDLMQSFTRLLPSTKNVSVALKQMGLAADVARAQNMSLEGATKLLIRANTGSAGALRKLGLSANTVKDAQNGVRAEMAAYIAQHGKLSPAMKEEFQQRLDAAKATDRHAQAVGNINTLQKTFGGAAADYGKTAAAAQDRFKVALENVQEAIGKGLLPILTQFANRLTDVLGWMEKNQGATKAIMITLGALVITLTAVSIASKISAASSAIAGAAFIGMGESASIADKLMRLTLIGLLITLAIALFLAWKKSETFRDIVTGALQAVADAARGVASFFTETIPHAFQAVLDWVSSNWPIIAAIVAGPFAPLVLLATDAFGVRSAIEGAIGGIIGWITGKATDIFNAGKAFGAKLKDGAVNGVTGIAVAVWNIVSGIGSALVGAAATVLGWGAAAGRKIKEGALDGVTGIATAVWNVVKGIGGAIAGAASTIIGWGRDIGVAMKDGAVATLGAIAEAVVSAIKKGVNAVIHRINSILEFSFDTHIPKVGKITVDAPDIPDLQIGGIIGEGQFFQHMGAGREAVVPLETSAGIGALATALEQALGRFGGTGRGAPAMHVENLYVNDPTDAELTASRISRLIAVRA